MPEGFELRQLDAALFARTDLTNHQRIVDWATANWGSVEQFLAHGFGFVLVHEQTIASWTLADCIIGERCEIGIHTDPNYRRRGLATIVVAANVAHALSHGLRMVGWQCSEDNLGSQGVAEKVGFRLTQQFPCYACEFAG